MTKAASHLTVRGIVAKVYPLFVTHITTQRPGKAASLRHLFDF